MRLNRRIVLVKAAVVANIIQSLTVLAPVSFISMKILPGLSTQIKLFGNENRANDHTQQFI